MTTTVLSIGGLGIEVSAQGDALAQIVDERYGAFERPEVTPVCSVSLTPNGIEKGQPNPPFAEVTGGGTPNLQITHVDFEAKLDLEGQSVVTAATDPYTVDHVFRLLVSALAPRHGALMLHACGVVLDGEGHVFAGESGAGKSTLASLASDRPVLSDEHVLVRRSGDGWVSASTPFWGAYALPSANLEAPLRRLWALRQSPAHGHARLDAADTLKLAVENCVMPSSEPAMRASVFDVAADLAESVPAAELRFAPVPSVWEEVEGARLVG